MGQLTLLLHDKCNMNKAGVRTTDSFVSVSYFFLTGRLLLKSNKAAQFLLFEKDGGAREETVLSARVGSKEKGVNKEKGLWVVSSPQEN